MDTAKLSADLSPHFTLAELTKTNTGLPNEPDTEALGNLGITAGHMEKVRELLLGHPINITSGYRSPEVNKAVGGSTNSAHMSGYAVDFKCPGFGTPIEIVRAIADSDIKFDQCIEEGTWVHFSVDPRMRQQVKTAHFAEGKPTTYTSGVG